MEAVAIFLLSVAFVAIVITAGTIFKGYALSVLWGWFLVPLGLPALSIPFAIGVCLVASLASHQYMKFAKDDREWYEDLGLVLGYAFLSPALALLVGWIVKQFV